MQHLVMDEACIDCYDLYQNEKKNGATGGYCGKATERQLAELLYQKRAEKLLSDENCFKVFIVSLILFFNSICVFDISSYFRQQMAPVLRPFQFYTKNTRTRLSEVNFKSGFLP